MGFDLLRAALLSLLLVLPPAWQLPLLPVIALGVGVGNAMFAIGLNSQLPYWVENSLRLTTNAWLTSVAASGAVLGSLVSGLLVAGFGYPVVFMLNVATYLAAALLILPLRMVETPQPRASQRDRFSEWRQLREGLRGAPMLAGMLIVSMADTLGSAAHNVGFPVLSALISPDSASKTMGLMLALWAVGKFAGARGSGVLLRQGQQRTMERAFFYRGGVDVHRFYSDLPANRAGVAVGVCGVGGYWRWCGGSEPDFPCAKRAGIPTVTYF
ncbi:MFS transporter [Dickeya oryzae]